MAENLEGKKAPAFQLHASDGKEVTLQDFEGKNLVLYFYPKDMTPSCTEESCTFRDFNGQFADYNTEVVGISPDNLKSHDKFIAKYDLPFLLLSDPDHVVAQQYGVWALKQMYGREYMGIVRSTFLIDATGRVVKEWRKVRVKNHVQEVLDAVKQLG